MQAVFDFLLEDGNFSNKCIQFYIEICALSFLRANKRKMKEIKGNMSILYSRFQ
uniref:hypothetical protein n=1 Tax=Candidatus Fimivicinus sp. TaxID=3056640 RepID=UPI003FED3F86